MEEPGRLQSMGLLRVGHDWATSLSLFPFMHWRRKWQPTPVFLPGESQGWGSLMGCRLWGHTESDTTEQLHFHFSLLCIGEGNGNPLQCSCLENPRDGEAWWAAVYGVAQSWTRLKWLSSSSRVYLLCHLGHTFAGGIEIWGKDISIFQNLPKLLKSFIVNLCNEAVIWKGNKSTCTYAERSYISHTDCEVNSHLTWNLS